MGINAGRGKVAYIWIPPDPTKVGLIWKGSGIVVFEV